MSRTTANLRKERAIGCPGGYGIQKVMFSISKTKQECFPLVNMINTCEENKLVSAPLLNKPFCEKKS